MNTTPKKYGARPWTVRKFPNGEPFIEDAEGYVVAQIIGTIRHDGDVYRIRNDNHAELICAAVNAYKIPLFEV